MKQTGHLRQQIKSITFAYQVVKCYNAQSNYDMKEDQTTVTPTLSIIQARIVFLL